MKRFYLFIMLLMILLSIQINAEESLYEFLKKVNQNYFIVLGLDAKGGDTLAALDVTFGINRNSFNHPNLTTVLENEVNPNALKILIGHPCDNSLIESRGFSCEEWPYEKGQAIIVIDENDLIVSGTTVEDTRRAAKVIYDYPDFQELKEYSKVVVLGFDFNPINFTIEPLKEEREFICGDKICEPGEKFTCFTDCLEKTCFDVCLEEDYLNASCKDIPSNPNLPFCDSDEKNKGLGYCTTGKACCCKNKKEIIQNKTLDINLSRGIAQQITEETVLTFATILKKYKFEIFITLAIIIFLLFIIFILIRKKV